MSKKVYIVSGIVFAVVLGMFLYIAERTPANQLLPPSNAFLTIEYTAPKWLKNHPQKEHIEQYIQQQYYKVYDGAMRLRQEFPDSALLPFDFSVDLKRDVISEYESILLAEHTYTGGAHGNTTYQYYNFKNNASLTLSEYLAERGVQEEYLFTLINEQLVRDGYNKIETLTDTPWLIHQANAKNPIGIRFIFPPYTVASFATGTITYIY